MKEVGGVDKVVEQNLPAGDNVALSFHTALADPSSRARRKGEDSHSPRRVPCLQSLFSPKAYTPPCRCRCRVEFLPTPYIYPGFALADPSSKVKRVVKNLADPSSRARRI